MASIAPQAPALTPERIMATGLGFWPAKTLLSAIELGVFSELAKGPLTLNQLTRRTGLHNRAARDFFDTLVALGMLDRKDGHYSNSPEADFFLDRAKPGYVGGMLEMANARLYPFWGNLTEALRTGLPQNEVARGENLFAQLYDDPERLHTFLSAMTGLTSGAGRVMARQFPWNEYSSFCDVGAAQGGVAVELAMAHPHLRGYGFDLPVVKAHFDEYVSGFGLSDRVQFLAGDFFKDPLPRADVILMGHILHDWGIDGKRMLVRKAYEALPMGGCMVVIEAVIDDERRHNAFGLMMSLNMLIETRDGFDFTGADCCEWMREAGFTSARVERLAGPDSMVIAVK
jgi:precorrin-6B methylase 2